MASVKYKNYMTECMLCLVALGQSVCCIRTFM